VALKELRMLPKADRRVRLGHAWVFSNEVDAARTPLPAFTPGELAAVRDARGNPVGIAYVNPRALICARILTRDIRATIDERWFAARIRRALSLRERIFSAPYYRLIYGESEGLPGLVVDRYGDVLAVQINTAGMMALREPLLKALSDVVHPSGIAMSSASVVDLEGIEAENATIGDVPADVDVLEGDLTIRVPLGAGQKTGYYYDQRDNRARLRRYVRDARVLDVFSYVGAWGASALRGGAAEVTCIDDSALALQFARSNAERNGGAILTVDGDALAVLRQLGEARQRYDVVILDPPALVKRRKDQAAGGAHYGQLHRAALRVLVEDGVLISSSCSQHVAADRLQRIALDAARAEGRRLQILERHGHAPDHPVHPAMPETEYLKALFLRA
jgi:23S rRNA (cytosine1962-C5)-methyltransferase